MEMLKNFARWFICFGLSFLVANVFGWTDQGRAFLYIYVGIAVAIVAIYVLLLLVAGVAYKEKLIAFGYSILTIIFLAIQIAIMLFATCGATKLFAVDYFVAFQIMTFGACLVTSSKKDDD